MSEQALRDDTTTKSLSRALAAPVAIVLFALTQPFVNARELFLEPHAGFDVAGIHVALLTKAGVSLAAIASATAFLAAIRAPSTSSRNGACLAGLLAALVAADDWFEWHEGLAPAIGVPEAAALCGYASLGFAAWRTRRAWMTLRASAVLFMSFAFLALSLGIDLAAEIAEHLTDVPTQSHFLATGPVDSILLLEDSLKFVGFWLWAQAHVVALRDHGA